MKHPLAHKSVGEIALYFIGTIVSLFGTVLTVSLFISGSSSGFDMLIYMIGLSFIFLLCLGLLIWGLMTPSTLIAYDEKGIYIYDYHKKESFVAFSDIVNVEGRPARARYVHAYSFGKMRMITRNGDFSIYFVSELKEVTERIITLKMSAQDDHDRKQEHFVD